MRLSTIVAFLLSGCATTLDPNYAAQLESYKMGLQLQHDLEVQRARTEYLKYESLLTLAETGNDSTRQLVLMAIALSGRGEGGGKTAILASPPQAPESQESRALKWAALFVGPVSNLAQGYFMYRLGVNQSNNNTRATIASYGAFSSIAESGFGAISNVGSRQPPAPNNITYTIGGDGVIGDGRFTGANSGTNSGNSGLIGNENRRDSPNFPPPPCIPTDAVQC